jgi:hypothetical protein
VYEEIDDLELQGGSKTPQGPVPHDQKIYAQEKITVAYPALGML